jgi:hypothetical protein
VPTGQPTIDSAGEVSLPPLPIEPRLPPAQPVGLSCAPALSHPRPASISGSKLRRGRACRDRTRMSGLRKGADGRCMCEVSCSPMAAHIGSKLSDWSVTS